ncbi:MAG: alpha/beta fold hydrolase [Cyanobacteria bacterium P01_F01_bin.42]
MSPPYQSAFPSQFWQWNQHRIHYVQQGDHGPNVLLIHGFGASTDHWRKTIEILSRTCRVWAIDLLGFGRSLKPKLSYTVDIWTEQLRLFCQEVIQAPAYVAGNSLGGYSALCFAVDHPDWVKGLMLLNCAGPFASQSPQNLSAWQQWRKTVTQRFFKLPGVIESLSLMSFLYFRRRSQIKKTLLKVYKDPDAVTDRLIEEIYQPAFDKGALGVFSAVFKSPPGRKLDELLTQLTCPMALIWGAADPWMSDSKAMLFQRAYPAAVLTLIDAGHCPHDERPEEVSEAMLAWLAEHSLEVDRGISSGPAVA